MKIHEYQAKQLMAARGIAVPQGVAVTTVDEAVGATRSLIERTGNPVVVVKSQIHAGGRGKGRFKEHPDVAGVNVILDGIEGGIEASQERVRQLAARMLRSTLVTIQTGDEGKQVNHLYIEQGIDIARELYLSVLLDRAASRNIVMASTEGGMEIEKVAEETPEKILRETIDPAIGLAGFQAARLGFGLELEGEAQRNFITFVKALTELAVELDTDLVEINPLVITTDGRVMALDGKMAFDDSGLFRHNEVEEMRDESEEDASELEAKAVGLSYIKLDGTIGCLVNGAGLAMATMDTIKHVGGEPANFLDVGGAANEESVTNAFKIILSDENVKVVLVNIFGGIVRCDIVAQGVIAAAKNVDLKVPVVVRLEGTNADEGLRLIEESGLKFETAKGLKAAAEKAVAAAGMGGAK